MMTTSNLRIAKYQIAISRMLIKKRPLRVRSILQRLPPSAPAVMVDVHMGDASGIAPVAQLDVALPTIFVSASGSPIN
jgi:hypothetical protein